MIFGTLIDAASLISICDLSENNMEILKLFLDVFRNRKLIAIITFAESKGKYLCKDDADCLKNALVHMPKLEILDISDNPLEDDAIMSLIPYFLEMSEKHSPFKDLKVESCELSCDEVRQLLSVLSSLIEPLNSLSIGGNDLGSKVGAPLGKFLGTGVLEL
ncbi:hypothetical protein RHMOL_Rhmol02G0215700 [Rhododendron molle]|uniref:Uncharacterized protein n=1 Tax=Rhododendron molle TaxID=49168 RepID=A0ACC0PV26_RHOML|nr:hypothetical protein RHMOL_Rhmol02G0215700 [Rhododendron molle]